MSGFLVLFSTWQRPPHDSQNGCVFPNCWFFCECFVKLLHSQCEGHAFKDQYYVLMTLEQVYFSSCKFPCVCYKRGACSCLPVSDQLREVCQSVHPLCSECTAAGHFLRMRRKRTKRKYTQDGAPWLSKIILIVYNIQRKLYNTKISVQCNSEYSKY